MTKELPGEEKMKALEKPAQEQQDIIFRKMTTQEKIHLVSSFFNFARTLNQLKYKNGTRRAVTKNRQDS